MFKYFLQHFLPPDATLEQYGICYVPVFIRLRHYVSQVGVLQKYLNVSSCK